MTITFACSCGQRLAVKEELAGRVGKCPKCGERLTIPAASAPMPVAPRQPTVSPASATHARRASPNEPNSPKPASPGVAADSCPGCGANMGARAVLCVACGYDKRLGKRLSSPAPEKARMPTQDPASWPGRPANKPRETPSLEWPADPQDEASEILRRQWKTTEMGLRMCFLSLVVTDLAVAVPIGFIVVGMRSPDLLKTISRYESGPEILCNIGLIASTISLVVGWGNCCHVPRQTGARMLVQGAVGCVAVGLLWFVASMYFTKISTARLGAYSAPLFAGVFFGYAMFALFLSRLNAHLGSNWSWPISITVVGCLGLFAVWCRLAASNPVDWAFPGLAAMLTIVTVVVTYAGLTWLTSDTWDLVKKEAQGRG